FGLPSQERSDQAPAQWIVPSWAGTLFDRRMLRRPILDEGAHPKRIPRQRRLSHFHDPNHVTRSKDRQRHTSTSAPVQSYSLIFDRHGERPHTAPLPIPTL